MGRWVLTFVDLDSAKSAAGSTPSAKDTGDSPYQYQQQAHAGQYHCKENGYQQTDHQQDALQRSVGP